PKKVWRALTDPVLLAEWLLPVVDGLKVTAGAPFTFKTQAHGDWDGSVHCSFLEVDAHKKLSYRWEAIGLDTVVTFTLTPTAAGTHLSLVQSGFKAGQQQNFAGARYGWKLMSSKLVDV